MILGSLSLMVLAWFHHEKPVVSLGSEEVFEAGMVISIEMEFRKYAGGSC